MENVSPTPLTLLERFNAWIQESIMIKLLSIGFLILVLLLPTAWIQELVYERQSRASGVLKEISNKWSASQTVSGPVLVIPFRKQEVIEKGKDGVEIRERIDKAFFLPEDLRITGSVRPEILHRGIFSAAVYESALNCSAKFEKPDFSKLNIPEDMVIWKDASLVFGMSDLRGISENPVISVGRKEIKAEPSNNIGVTVRSRSGALAGDTDREYVSQTDSYTGIVAKLNLANADDFRGDVSISLNLKGSERIDFVPSGKTTNVSLQGDWNSPSFDGEFVPSSRELTNEGFNATWKILHFNRPFAQHWINNSQSLSGSEFGVKLLIPVDHYQKSIRSSKYGVLMILLTFMALFLVEITQKIRIHPFQYILIGSALTIYYTLLLSISEHVGYNISYIIASTATVILISLYARTFLTDSKLVALFASLLTVFYAFIFVLILQQDFALLLGSIGLFIIVGLVMYFSRNIRWYDNAQRNMGSVQGRV